MKINIEEQTVSEMVLQRIENIIRDNIINYFSDNLDVTKKIAMDAVIDVINSQIIAEGLINTKMNPDRLKEMLFKSISKQKDFPFIIREY
ncbi:MAG: hypothetical protein NT007_19375 [Candidatus Kapabacteria bacterium]|nr:hypothetical protein [Candidatus Kapabacteria bacterium]